MTELLGIPMSTVMWVFGGALIFIVAWSVAMALRQPVLFRLGVRNIPRRWGRSALIVLGLTLATTIITAALATGDTIRNTGRSEVLKGLGNIDEVISAQEESDIEITGEATQLAYFPESNFESVRSTLEGFDDVDGVMPAIWEEVGVQNLTRRQTEPRVLVFGADPAYMRGFGTIKSLSAQALSLSDLGPDEVYLNREGGKELDASAGDELAVYAAGRQLSVKVREVVDFDGGGTTDPLIIMTLAQAQDLFQKPVQIKHIIISNSGDAESGVALTNSVIEQVRPALTSLGLAIEPTKRDDLQEADDFGAAFSSFFVTFGSFSIAAGVLLIFLIFVMLSTERKSEMGIARAIGTERVHLIEMFLFEGLLYDLGAAAIGTAFGVAVAMVMVSVLASAFGDLGLDIRFGVTTRSLITAGSMGVVLTFLVVLVSAWRVSILNIVTAIRNLPEPVAGGRGRASLVWGVVFLLFGALLALSGLSAKQSAPFLLGASLIIIAFLPLARWLGAQDRLAFTVVGLLLVIWWLIPANWLDPVLPDMSSDFTVFVLSGLIVVTGSTWLMMYNSDAVTSAILATVGRVRALAPVLKTALTYPLTNRFRTGVTLAMFTLVVFTMVVGSITVTAFTEAFNDNELYGGGFDIRANTVPANPITDMSAAIGQAPDLNPSDFDLVSNQSTVAVEARQTSTDLAFGDYPLRGLDDVFLDNNSYGFGLIAEGYGSPAEVWQALKADPRLAVVDAIPAPRLNNFGFGAPVPDFKLEGFYMEDETFEPIPIEVRDPISGETFDLTVIAILKEVVPINMIGVGTSQRFVQEAFPDQATPNAHLIKIREGGDVDMLADALESSFLANGLEATLLKDELEDVVSINRAFNYIVQGFLGLGLIVGVAALGVISARAVVERRQEIGVMRAIGFEQPMVQLSFLIESSMVALAGIILGTGLGMIVAFNVIQDSRTAGSWENLSFIVPWLNFAIIYLLVYGAALATSFVPARQASRVYPAEALRYE